MFQQYSTVSKHLHFKMGGTSLETPGMGKTNQISEPLKAKPNIRKYIA